MRTTIKTLAIILMFATTITSCSRDDSGNDLPDNKTAVTIGEIGLSDLAIAGSGTRTTSAADFFVAGDELILTAAGEIDYTTTYVYTAAGAWELKADAPTIWYEDVTDGTGAATHTFTLTYGTTERVADQTDAVSMHAADAVSGTAVLGSNAVLSCPAMTRLNTLISIVLSPEANNWGNVSMVNFLAGCGVTIDGIAPAISTDTEADAVTYTAIIPTAALNALGTDVALLTIELPEAAGGATHTMSVPSEMAGGFAAGTAYTIAADYGLRAGLGVPTIGITDWNVVAETTPLPGLTPDELAALRAKTAFLAWADNERTNWTNADFTLTADIDLTGIDFAPIPGYGGTFDGAGFTITGLTVKTDGYRAGMFLNLFGTVKNLTLARAAVSTTDTNSSSGGIAALAANHYGTIANCRVVNSTVAGGVGSVGGIAGWNAGAIIACTVTNTDVVGGYTTGGVVGFSQSNTAAVIACHVIGGDIASTASPDSYYTYAGGILGRSLYTMAITACYASPASLTPFGGATDTYVGGVTGFSTVANLTANYWNSAIEGADFGNGRDNDRDVNATPTAGLTAAAVAAMNEAIAVYNLTAAEGKACDYHWTLTGLAAGAPVYSPAELASLLAKQEFLAWADKVRTVDTAADFTLTADIDLTGSDFTPILYYGGAFDGAGFTITGLTVETDATSAGMFIDMIGTVKNLTLARAAVSTTDAAASNGRIAVLTAYNGGTIEHCRVVNSAVRGGVGYVGGLAGNNGGTIVACTVADTDVAGGFITGGIVGFSNSAGSAVIACHVTGGDIASTAAYDGDATYAGGIIGYADGNDLITACYAAPASLTPYGDATSPFVGGVAGFSAPANLTANYWNTAIEGVTFGNGNPSGSDTDATPTDGLTAEQAAIMTAEIPAPYTGVYEWTTTGIIKK